MYVTDLEMAKFFNNFARGINQEISTEEAIKIFKKKGDSRYFSLIYMRVYKAINLLALRFNSAYLTKEDIQSHCLEKLLESINKWDKTKSNKFITFYYNNVRNLLYVLVHQKYFRDLNRSWINFTDYLKDETYEREGNVLEFLTVPDEQDPLEKINFNSGLLTNDQNKIVDFILKHNFRNTSDICNCLGINKKYLRRNIAEMQKVLRDF